MPVKSKLQTYLPLLIAFVGVISALLGATVSHFWSRSLALEEQVLNIKKSAYSDFLHGQSLLWEGPAKFEEANQIITRAKLSILLTSSQGVICSMTNYWLSAFKYKDCPEPELRKKDAAIYQQMRKEFFKTLNIAGSSNLEAAIVVPYIWSCSLPGEPLDKVCKTP
jgi:hypothetical protein